MAHRNLFHASQMPTMDPDQTWNTPHHDPHLDLGAGNGSFMLPIDGAARTAVSRPNEHHISSFSNYMVTNSGSLYDPYFHHSSTASSSRFPPDQVLGMPLPSFNQHVGGMVNPLAETGRATYKRKSPSVPQAFSGGNISGFYSSGHSSNLQMSSDPLLPKPVAMPPYWLVDPGSVTNSYRSDNHLTAGEDPQRNVRSRLNHVTQLEINPAMVHSSSNVPPHFHVAGTFPGISMEGQSSHMHMPMASQGRNFSSDSCFNYEGSHSLAGHGVINTTLGSNVVSHPNLTQNRNISSFPTLHDPIARGICVGGIGYNQRSNHHRPSSSHTSVGFTTTMEGDGGPHRMEPIASSRYSRPLSITGRSSHRSGRMSSYSRPQSRYNEDAARSRWSSEAAVMMDRATYYDSRNWFDHHRDMRLDIDNMSYEELLDLEERIGNVNTGLSEETISGCLQETTHCSSNTGFDQEEGNCAICLEEYKDQDRLGKLSCRHDFHVGCVKKWLLIKNACPICKAAALSDSPTETQT